MVTLRLYTKLHPILRKLKIGNPLSTRFMSCHVVCLISLMNRAENEWINGMDGRRLDREM